MCQCNMWGLSALVIVLSSVLVFVQSYNVETVNFVKHTWHDPESMFGFSVAPHMVNHQSWIIVGAPEAQSPQPGVFRGGAVFNCSVTADNACDVIRFDSSGDHDGLDQKSKQWFGATVSSAGRDRPIVACAPRYVWFTSKRDRRDPVGTCYVADADFSNVNEYAPCRTNHWGYHRQGSCQAGLGAAISKDGRRLFVGAPGSWYWQGQVYSIDSTAIFPYQPGLFGYYGAGQVIQQSLENRPASISTREGTERDDDSYMGYSVAVGDFTGEGVQGAAVGMPRGESLSGKVLLFTWNLTNYYNISGTQIGSYFGYSIAVGDIDGDGKDDLIIGAPMFTLPNNENKYEVGRVYVMYQQSEKGRFSKLHTLDGTNSKGRFGLSVGSLGDINLDGYGDFVVGAPYDGPFERGAIYIYHGSAKGVQEKYSQVIYAEDVTDKFGPKIETFGFSVSGGLDLDHNDYPDVVVGAYLSNTAFFLRSRPVVKAEGSLKFHTTGKQIKLENRNCTLSDRSQVACTKVELCIKLSGIGIPDVIDLVLNYTLDSRKPSQQRLYFMMNDKYTLLEPWQLYRDQLYCRTKEVYIKNNIRDKLTPLEVSVNYAMRSKREFTQYERNPNAPLNPILDLGSAPIKKDHISIMKNCGADDKCVPDLNMIVNASVNRYLLGSNQKLSITVTVRNIGEDSYESVFQMDLPPNVHYNKVVQLDKKDVHISCDEFNNTVNCDIGNPLPAHKISQFMIELQPQGLVEGVQVADSYNFVMRVNSSNPEEGTGHDNIYKLSIPIWIDSKMEIGGSSRPPDVHYNASLYTEEVVEKEAQIGPYVVHLYSIMNTGASPIEEAEVMFLWPSQTLDGQDLFYLLEAPLVTPERRARCQLVQQPNYRNYTLESRSKSFWQSIGVASKGEASLEALGGSGVIVQQGAQATGVLHNETGYKVTEFEERRHEGDSSNVFEERHKGKGTSAGSTSAGGQTVVHVGDDGSNVVQVTTSQTNRTGGPGTVITTTTTTKNTTYYSPTVEYHYVYGPDGRLIKNITTTSGGSGYVVGGGHQGQHIGSSGGSSAQHVTTTYQERPHVIYSSSGNQQESHQISTHGSQSTHSTSHGVGSTVTGQQQQGNVDLSVSGSGGRRQPAPDTGDRFKWDNGGSSGRTQSGRRYEETHGTGGHTFSSEEFTREDLETRHPATTHRDEGHRRTQSQESYGTQWQGGQTHGTHSQGTHSQGAHWQGSQSQGTHMQSSHSQGNSGQSGHGQGQGHGSSVTHHVSWTTGNQGAAGHQKGDADYEESYEEYDYSEEANQDLHESTHGGSTNRQETGGSYGYGGSSGDRRDYDHSYNRSYTWSTGGGDREGGSSHQTGGSTSGGSTYQSGGSTYQSGGSTHQSGGHQSAGSGHYGGSTHQSGGGAHYGGGISGTSATHFGGVSSGRDPSTYGRHGSREESSQGGFNENAFGGSGFRTVGLDLGVLGGDNSITGGSSQSGYGIHGSQSHGASSTGTHSSTYGGQGGHQSGGGYESRSETHWSSSGSGYPHHHEGRDNVHTDRPVLENRFHGKRKRQADDYFDGSLESLFDCHSTQCLKIKCTVGPLPTKEEILIALRGRVNAQTLKSVSPSNTVSVSTMMVSRISKLQNFKELKGREIRTHEIFTTLTATEAEAKPDIVPLWVVVVSAVAGTLILLLLILLLYMCGFFKRNRPSNAPERQPLRNGY